MSFLHLFWRTARAILPLFATAFGRPATSPHAHPAQCIASNTHSPYLASAIFAYGGKVMGSNFAQPLDGGVFGSEALRRVWYVTEAANLLRILARTT